MTGWSVRGNNNITMVLESVMGNNINIVLEYVRGNNMVLKRELLCSLKLESRTLSKADLKERLFLNPDYEISLLLTQL